MSDEYNRSELCRMAAEAATRAYAPYSHFHVGAVVVTDDGCVFTGCNVENGSYGLTICAERVAIGTAIAAGHRNVRLVVVATVNGVTPCGACRQVLNEFATDDCDVLLVNLDGDLLHTTTLAKLFPNSFDAPPN